MGAKCSAHREVLLEEETQQQLMFSEVEVSSRVEVISRKQIVYKKSGGVKDEAFELDPNDLDDLVRVGAGGKNAFSSSSGDMSMSASKTEKKEEDVGRDGGGTCCSGGRASPSFLDGRGVATCSGGGVENSPNICSTAAVTAELLARISASSVGDNKDGGGEVGEEHIDDDDVSCVVMSDIGDAEQLLREHREVIEAANRDANRADAKVKGSPCTTSSTVGSAVGGGGGNRGKTALIFLGSLSC